MSDTCDLAQLPVVLTTAEASALLRVDRRTLYELARRRIIPHRHVGRKLRFERDALLRWLRGNAAPNPTGGKPDGRF